MPGNHLGKLGSFKFVLFRFQRIRCTVDEREQKKLMMDLEVVMKSNLCPVIVKFYGAVFKEGDCWICMELMDSSLEQFYKYVYRKMGERIPENIIGKMALVVTSFHLTKLIQ